MTYNIAPEYVSLFFSGILLVYHLKNEDIPTLKNRMFTFALFATFFSNLVTVISVYMKDHYREYPLSIVHFFNVAEFILAPLMALAYANYLVTFIWEEDSQAKGILKIVSVPFVMYSAAVLTTPVTGLFYSFQEPQGYTLGEGYLLIYALPSLYILFMMGLILLRGHNLETQMRFILLSFPAMAFLLVAIQYVYPELVLSGSAATSALLIITLKLQKKEINEDNLTGLQNRKAFSQMLMHILKHRLPRNIIIVSLDEFKMINNQFGYANGDIILKEISHFIKSVAARNNVYRYGGDEFALIDEETNSPNREYLIDTIQNRFKQPWLTPDFSYMLTASIAAIQIPQCNVRTVEEAIGLLEHCIGTSKGSGKGKVVMADAAMQDKIQRRNQIFEILKNAIANNSFEVYYQPLYSLEKSRFVSAEALVRLADKELGSISPGEFIPIAEETGMIIDIGYQVLDQVCRFIQDLEKAGKEIASVSVNFSSYQMFKEDMATRVLDIIHKNRIDSRKIRIEITESVFIDKVDGVQNIIKNLMAYGIAFDIDDFGTGYSNLSLATKLPFKGVKVDKSLLDDAMTRKESFIALKALAGAFSEMGREVIIEGVETEEQRELLDKIDCHLLQGYFYARPMIATEAIRYFAGA